MKKLIVEVDGELMTVSEIAKRYGLNRDTVLARLRKGLEVTVPVASRNKKLCVVCGAEFLSPPSGKQTCSKSCSAAHRSSSYGSHHMSDSRLYKIWCGMKSRCSSENNGYSGDRYAKRGVTVCDEWRTFLQFRDWALANGYQDDLEIDRIDNRMGYSPTNCRWATRQQQSRNKRKRRSERCTSRFKGVSKAKSKWRATIHADGVTTHLGVFENEVDAAKAYDKAAIELHGDFACLNFGKEVASC